MAVVSKIENLGGVPTLTVNGKPLPGLAYITYLTQRADYKGMTAAGYRIFSVPTFFATRSVNAAEKVKPFAPGIFENRLQPDFSALDAAVQQVLAACPTAYLLPRVNVNLPRWWEEAHPEELNDEGMAGQPPRACLAGQCYLEDACRFLKLYLQHAEAAPYADRILGYQLAGGQTEEWLSLDGNGNQGEALRAAFAQSCPGETDPVVFHEFVSDVTADTVVSLARYAKELLGGRKVIGAFYGYTFETPWWQAGHGALAALLQEEAVDFLCSPLSYAQLRPSGVDWACMTALNSLQQNNKLYFAEADVRTCLTLPLAASWPGACEEKDYAGGIWQGPKTVWECVQQLRAVFCRALTHGTALWWFDMWGGWYNQADLHAELAAYPPLAKKALKDSNRASVAELAVFTDERSPARLAGCPSAEAAKVVSQNRIPLGAFGAPYDVFELTDFDAVNERYSAAVFLVPADTEAMAAALAEWAATGRPFLVADPARSALKVSALRALCRRAGIHLYAQKGKDVVYVSHHWLAVHAAAAGEKVLSLPEERRITPVLPAGKSFRADTVCVTLQMYETRLFRLD